jgi:alpha-glucoside transport system permease protein
MNVERVKAFLVNIPLHVVIVVLVIAWLTPTLGIFVTSFRTPQAISQTGWWTAILPQLVPGKAEYGRVCASCHGADGTTVEQANLTDPKMTEAYANTARLLVLLRGSEGSHPALQDQELQALVKDASRTRDALGALAPVTSYLGLLSGGAAANINRLTASNWIDALVGYRGTATYQADCATGKSQSGQFYCDARDLLNPGGMARALVNSAIVTVPATALVLLFAALAAYAFAWLDFPGRIGIFVLLVGLQVVPLQMSLVPIAQLYVKLGIQNSFVGVWLFHTGFGLPYAIYLMRNFLGGLPKELFESIYMDGANHWIAFWRLALPLAVPAIASLAIFQFLWVWNDLLVAMILIPGHPVLTYQITNLIDPRGSNWNLLTAAAFLSMIVPMMVFLAFQRYFIRGLLAGAVKG